MQNSQVSRWKIQKAVLVGAAVLGCGIAVAMASPAQATLMLQTGLVGGSGDVDNVVFAPCGLNRISSR